MKTTQSSTEKSTKGLGMGGFILWAMASAYFFTGGGILGVVCAILTFAVLVS